MSFLCAIDPGKDGGVALLNHQHVLLDHFEMPTMTGHGKSLEIDVCKLRDRILLAGIPDKVFIELVGPHHLASKKSTWSFARNFEALVSLCKLQPWNWELVDPKVWQKVIHAGQYKGKQTTLAWVRRNFSQLQDLDHDGIADSIALAEFGFRQFFASRS